MNISVLVPSIRPHLLEGVYNSIAKSFTSGSWELIIISPYPIPKKLENMPDIVYIHDAGTPIRGRQRGLIAAQGDYICYAADDVTFYPNSLDIAFNKIKDKDYKTIILGKYREGEEINSFMDTDSYWYLLTHDALRPIMHNIPRDYKLLNTGLISKKLLIEIGGFDCKYETCSVSCLDLSIRLQNYGCPIIIQKEPIFYATHLPMHLGDHSAIHNGQTQHDFPLFLSIYMDERSKKHTTIDIDNWEKASDWWVRRFGVKEEICTHDMKDRLVVAGKSTCGKCGEIEP